MPYKIKSLDGGGIITSFSGRMTDEIYIKAIKERWFSPEAILNCHFFISDLTDVDQFELTPTGIQKSANINIEASKINKNILAVGVLPTDLEFGLGRMWQAYANQTNWNTYTSRSLDEAMQWICNNL